MLFHVIIGGILLSKRECYTIAATGSLLFAVVALGEWAGVIPHYPLGLFSHVGADEHSLWLPYGLTAITVHASILFPAGYFVTSLSERLHHNERRLSDLAEQALADHNLLRQALDTTRTGLRVLSTELCPEWTNERWDACFGKSGNGCKIFRMPPSP